MTLTQSDHLTVLAALLLAAAVCAVVLGTVLGRGGKSR